MKKTLLATLTVVLASATFAQTKYVDKVIAADKITVTKNVSYGDNYTVLTGTPTLTSKVSMNPGYGFVAMTADIYEPQDGASNRPLIIFCHSGSFLPRYSNNSPVGYKDDSATVAFCMSLAQRGYVVASMTWRMGWNPGAATVDLRKQGIINAAYKGVQDLATCVRFMKKSVKEGGNPYKIDTTKIAVGGNGTGGYITSAYASIDRQSEIKSIKFRDASTGKVMVNDTMWGDRTGVGIDNPAMGMFCKSNHVGYTSNARLAFAVGGAIGDSAWIEKGEIPLIWSHSVMDPFAPYTTGMVNVPGTTLQVVEVSGGFDAMNRCQRLGNTSPYKGKVMDDYTRAANVLNKGIDGLFPVAGLANASGPYEWYDTARIKMLPSPPYSPAVILAGIKASNPMHSKAKSMKYVDSIMGYMAPRIAVSLGLVATVGIDNTNLGTNVTLAPNPAKNQLIIHNNWDNRVLLGASLVDINGRVVREFAINGNHNVYELNVPTGIYVVRMQFNDGVGSSKLMVD
ncbi:MAG: T9SS type A sorting domain-containing protein [Bacteroidetes bacterium]|nr:T9SS type A sorting domain-containing protein [Bacteroidota bacterium]MDA1223880.1 T9SS type A sorting domain-containing protein [Bacteroidota bacterium]